MDFSLMCLSVALLPFWNAGPSFSHHALLYDPCEPRPEWAERITVEDFKEKRMAKGLEETEFRDLRITGDWLWGRYDRESDLPNFIHLDMRGTFFERLNLQGSSFAGADLSGAAFDNCDLKAAQMYSNLSGARLIRSRIEQADFSGANFTSAKFALDRHQNLSPEHFVAVEGLDTIRMVSPATASSFYALKEEFKKRGLRDQERALNTALRRRATWEASLPEAILQFIAFDLTVEYGNSPWRAFGIMSGAMVLFAVPYAVVLRRPRGGGRIWQVWHPDRIFVERQWRPRYASRARRTSPHIIPKERTPLLLSSSKAVFFGLYFSILSAFHFGWRDLNVGNWIARIQPNEYSLRPTGWVRTLSGVQSLLSVYLVALWALSYFGRPFD